jgi:hypothetical protein
VLHEWHGPVNNLVVPPTPAGQPPEISSDSQRIIPARDAAAVPGNEPRAVHVPFWCTGARDLTNVQWLNGHMLWCLNLHQGDVGNGTERAPQNEARGVPLSGALAPETDTSSQSYWGSGDANSGGFRMRSRQSPLGDEPAGGDDHGSTALAVESDAQQPARPQQCEARRRCRAALSPLNPARSGLEDGRLADYRLADWRRGWDSNPRYGVNRMTI